MNKNRLENFSDGVFSIAVTLLVLNISVNTNKGITNSQLNKTLLNLTSHLLTFLFSFLVIGVFWVAHHRIFSFVKILDSNLLWINIVYLMFIAVIPFPASILAEHPRLITAILIYTATLFIIASFHFVLLWYISDKEEIKHEALTKEAYRSALKIATFGPICYILAAASSFIHPYISFFFIAGSMVFYIFFSGRGKVEDQLLNTASDKNG